MSYSKCLMALFLVGLSACGKSSSSGVSITRVEPPVQSAAGSSLSGTSPASRLSSASPSFRRSGTSTAFRRSDTRLARDSVSAEAVSGTTIQARFFSGGPTDVLRILSSVDSRLADIESRSTDGDHPCLTASPVATQLTLFGQPVDFAFQCYDLMDGGAGIVLFGKQGSTWSVYVNVGAGPVAAKATDLGGGKTDVEVWGAVGYGNTPTWDAMSYTGFHLKANDATSALELTAGGIGVGFCGVTLKGDGTSLYAYGSEDMGATCNAIASSCVLRSDLATAGSCGAIDESRFELVGLGRAATAGSNTGMIPATWGASTYPASGPTLTVTGAANDMLDFGIHSEAEVPAGVGAF